MNLWPTLEGNSGKTRDQVLTGKSQKYALTPDRVCAVTHSGKSLWSTTLQPQFHPPIQK